MNKLSKRQGGGWLVILTDDEISILESANVDPEPKDIQESVEIPEELPKSERFIGPPEQEPQLKRKKIRREFGTE